MAMSEDHLLKPFRGGPSKIESILAVLKHTDVAGLSMRGIKCTSRDKSIVLDQVGLLGNSPDLCLVINSCFTFQNQQVRQTQGLLRRDRLPQRNALEGRGRGERKRSPKDR